MRTIFGSLIAFFVLSSSLVAPPALASQIKSLQVLEGGHVLKLTLSGSQDLASLFNISSNDVHGETEYSINFNEVRPWHAIGLSPTNVSVQDLIGIYDELLAASKTPDFPLYFRVHLELLRKYAVGERDGFCRTCSDTSDTARAKSDKLATEMLNERFSEANKDNSTIFADLRRRSHAFELTKRYIEELDFKYGTHQARRNGDLRSVMWSAFEDEVEPISLLAEARFSYLQGLLGETLLTKLNVAERERLATIIVGYFSNIPIWPDSLV